MSNFNNETGYGQTELILPSVAVLMSTYNGERFLREQLNSIFMQEGVYVRLFVRDDGSSDSTVSILKEYAQRYPITIIQDGENVGPGESFMRLVYKYANNPEIEFYAFADQDDIWLEDKLNVAVKKIMSCEYSGPILYSSNQYLYVNGENKGNRHKEKQKIDLISHMTKNTIAGCTFVFNKELAQAVSNAGRPDQRIIKHRIHDAWMMLVAIVNGNVIYDETSHMLYRIHDNNAVGIRNTSLTEKVNRMIRLFGRTGNSNLRMITAIELLRLFPEMKRREKSILLLYANYKTDATAKIKLFCNREIVAGCLENPILFRFKVLMGVV